MTFHGKTTEFSVRRPRTVMLAVLGLAVALGSLIPRIVIDTDPENMLPADQSARVFHNKVKRDFTLYDMIIVGVVNDRDPDGVFNPVSLARVDQLTRGIERIEGVIRQEVLSLSTVDNIEQGGLGEVRFEWLMRTPPETREEARAIREAAERIPTIAGTLLSEDGKAVGIYVPIEAKDASHRIAGEIQAIIDGFDGDEQYYITGLPVAEDTFGVEMFKQMGISAPLAGLLVFLLMWFFFRSFALVVAPMIVAMVTVIATMGLLIGFGFTVHIMSSMIPIFLMPIAVVDSVHILSEFADLYPRMKDRERTIGAVMENLFTPMLYTSLTSAAGFASLALAPIPPVRVFGVFIAIGILLAFVLTITFIPAYIARLSSASIAKLGTVKAHDHHFLARSLAFLGPRAVSSAKITAAITLIVVLVSAVGIARIQINDNPVRWFRSDHSIRVADRVLNEHFAGTYNAFLVLEASGNGTDHTTADAVGSLLAERAIIREFDLSQEWEELYEAALPGPEPDHLGRMIDAVYAKLDEASESEIELWEEVLVSLEDAEREARIFQTPGALGFIAGLQEALSRSDLVGKSNSVTDIVKTVHRELRDGDPRYFSVPETPAAVAQTLLSYQSSHRPDDLWHFVTPDYRAANIWLQLKSGDNQDMLRVTEQVAEYLEANPPPEGTVVGWAGLTYLNVVWQDDMVKGMPKALLGSFVIVFIMMLVLFRSLPFALLAMLPLSVTIAFIYGLVGLSGKDYDMPIAVLSSLTLGLSVDFAIHLLQRARAIHGESGDWTQTVRRLFAEPARAITRNAIVISVGFLPLVASPLVPYSTVGIFLATIMVISCLVTLILLPGVMGLFKRRLFAASILFAVLGLPVATPAAAQDLASVAEIVQRANLAAYYAGSDGRASVRMTITDAQGRNRIRQFVILRRDVNDGGGGGGDQDYAVLFSRPADVRNTVFLTKKHVGGDDDRWLYLPGLDLVKRIAAGDKRTSFVGSHFLYEDMSGRAIEEDEHELLETNDTHYVVKNTPVDPGSVEFTSWTVWIDKTTFLPTKMEYVDDAGEVYRRIEALEVAEFGGHPTVIRMRVSDLRSGGYTVSEFSNVQYDLDIPENLFTERTLRNPSRRWFSAR